MATTKNPLKINVLLFLAGASLIFTSCGKSSVKPTSNDSTKTTGTTTAGAGIYVAGYESTTNDIGQTFQVAKIFIQLVQNRVVLPPVTETTWPKFGKTGWLLPLPMEAMMR